MKLKKAERIFDNVMEFIAVMIIAAWAIYWAKNQWEKSHTERKIEYIKLHPKNNDNKMTTKTQKTVTLSNDTKK